MLFTAKFIITNLSRTVYERRIFGLAEIVGCSKHKKVAFLNKKKHVYLFCQNNKTCLCFDFPQKKNVCALSGRFLEDFLPSSLILLEEC